MRRDDRAGGAADALAMAAVAGSLHPPLEGPHPWNRDTTWGNAPPPTGIHRIPRNPAVPQVVSQVPRQMIRHSWSLRDAAPSSAVRLPTGQAQRAHDQLQMGCHVMPFPPHSCMNRYQSGNSGPAATLGRSKEYSASHVASGPSHHEVVNAKTQRKDEQRWTPSRDPTGRYAVRRSEPLPHNRIGLSGPPHTRSIRSEAGECGHCPHEKTPKSP